MTRTRLSEITLDKVRNYCGVSGADSDGMLEIMTAAARSFLLNRTGLSAEEADEYPDLTLAAFVLINEMFSNRTYAVDSTNMNPFVENIIGQYRMNLL